MSGLELCVNVIGWMSYNKSHFFKNIFLLFYKRKASRTLDFQRFCLFFCQLVKQIHWKFLFRLLFNPNIFPFLINRTKKFIMFVIGPLDLLRLFQKNAIVVLVQGLYRNALWKNNVLARVAQDMNDAITVCFKVTLHVL